MAAATMAMGQLAGAGSRFVAALIDGILSGIVLGIFLVLAGGSSSSGGIVGIGYLIVVLYYPVLWAFWDGQTIGKKAMNIKVVRSDGSRIGLGRAILRYIGYIVDSVIFGLPIGFLWILFDGKKQGWHDKIADTVVVRA